MTTPLAIPTLRTQRLTLEALGAAHSAGMFAMWSQEAVCRHSGPARDARGRPIRLPARTAADSDRIIDFFVRRAAAGRGLRWAMLENGRFVGALGFNHVAPIAEIAWHLDPAAWGRGLAAEAARAALAWISQAAPQEVCAFIEPDNLASIRLAERLGFRAGEGDRYVRRA